MLHTEVVDDQTLELLTSLHQKKYFAPFYLVGGTALALYYGHRRSVDIDLFSNTAFDAGQLLEQIQQDFSYQLFSTAQYTLKGNIAGVNVDIIAHRYPYVEEPFDAEGISLLSEKDIIAMKLNAISVSGQRSKDFIDLYYALKHHPISDMLSFYKVKYDQKQAAHVLKSLVYFEDVDLEDWPVLLKDPDLKWEAVKKKIVESVKKFTLEE